MDGTNVVDLAWCIGILFLITWVLMAFIGQGIDEVKETIEDLNWTADDIQKLEELEKTVERLEKEVADLTDRATKLARRR